LTALLAGAVGISFAAPLAKLAVQDGGVGWVASAFWRTTLAAPLLVAVVLLYPAARRQARSAVAGRHLVLLIPGILFALDLLTWHVSFAWTTAASATLLANLGVVLVGLAGWLWLKEHLDGRYLIGATAALVGVAWLVLVAESPGEAPHRVRGDLMALSTAVFYAAYILSIKHLRATTGAATLMAVATIASSVVLAACALGSSEPLLPSSGGGWGWLVLLAVVPHCLGQGLIVLSLASLPASFAAVTLLVQPVATAVWGWVFLDEALSVGQVSAGGLVIVGIVLARLGSGR
jgi:drug/metabolite transporter (DMT)-like permease